MGEMKEPDVAMKETNFLAGLFQKIVDDCKTELPLFDEFLGKSVKLQGQLKATSIVFGSFLDTFQKIADCASNTKGSSTDLGICLTRMVLRHRAIEAHLKTLTSALTDCCTFPIQTKKEEWRRRVGQLEKDHTRQFKKTRAVLKKRAESVVKLDKKMKKGKVDPELVKLRESLVKDHQLKSKLFEEQERAAVREIACQERTHYTTFAACLKPLVIEEFAMLREVEQLDGVMEKVNKIIMDPFKNLESSDDILSFVKHSDESFCFATPPSTPSHSSLGSRTGSVRSINSFSRPPSVASSKDSESVASRTNSFSSDKDLYSRANKRSSTISSFSQDSGFTSQDAFSIRQNISHVLPSKAPSRQCSPQSQVPGARCQGQAGRPQLYSQGQGYTVGGSPARNYSTVKRCHSPYQQPSQGGHYAAPVTCRPPLPHRSKPPPPLRCSSLDRGAARGEERGAQSPPHYSAPANNTPVPPVAPRLSQGPEYGNLAALASAGGADHYGSPGGVTLLGSPGGVTLLGSPGGVTLLGSPEGVTLLESPGEDSKTPTNERLSILEFQSDSVSSSSSGGSIGSTSSGYSSQGPGPQYSSQGPGPQYSSQGPGPQYSSQGTGPQYSSQGPGPQYSSQGTLCSRTSSRQPAGRPPLPPQALPCTTLEQGEEVTPHSSMEQLPPPPAAFLLASKEHEQGGQGRFKEKEQGGQGRFMEQEERAKLILALNARLSCSLLDQGQEGRSSSAQEGGSQAGQGRRAVSAHERTATGGERGVAPQGPGPMERRGVAPSPPVRSLYGGRRSKEEAAVYSNTGPQPVYYM